MTFPSRLICSAKDRVFRFAMPYGMWTCIDGRQVLFNREYQPIWSRWLNDRDTLIQADPNEWVYWERQRWFYTGCFPRKLFVETERHCYKVLKAFCEGRKVDRYVVNPGTGYASYAPKEKDRAA